MTTFLDRTMAGHNPDALAPCQITPTGSVEAWHPLADLRPLLLAIPAVPAVELATRFVILLADSRAAFLVYLRPPQLRRSSHAPCLVRLFGRQDSG